MNKLEMFILVVVVLVLQCLMGCSTKKHYEYYPPTEEHCVVLEKEDGTKEIRGAIKSEVVEETFTLGTSDMASGERNYLPINLGNVN